MFVVFYAAYLYICVFMTHGSMEYIYIYIYVNVTMHYVRHTMWIYEFTVTYVYPIFNDSLFVKTHVM
jgi:hypothetical protein